MKLPEMYRCHACGGTGFEQHWDIRDGLWKDCEKKQEKRVDEE